MTDPEYSGPRASDQPDDTAKYGAIQEVDKMQIWSSQRNTPQGKTKKVTQRGGYTTVNPQYQLQRATELWGPIGDKWGIEIQSTEFVKTDVATVVWFHVKFYYPSVYDGRRVEFDMINDHTLKPNDDCAKKLMTNTRSKALSCLGFSSDVYEGLYENTQYLQDEEIRERPDDFIDDFVTRVSSISDIAKLQAATGRVRAMRSEGTLNESYYNRIMEAIKEREIVLLAS